MPALIMNSKAERANVHDTTEGSVPDVQKSAQKPLDWKKQTVNGILINGDPSQIALMEPKISAFFSGKEVISHPEIRPDEAIIRGASKHASILAGAYSDGGWIGCSMDITVFSLGIETAHGAFSKIVPRFSLIPTYRQRLLSTVRDNREKVVIKVFERDRAIASKNKSLGVLELMDLPLGPRGELDIEIVFEVDPDRGVTVRVREMERGREAKIVVPAIEMKRYT
ncbi:Hsp70 chaperone [Clarireedia jacksonii]